MRAVMAIARKELTSYFFAPMAYIVIAAFLLMNGFIFSVILAALSQPGAFSAQPMLLFFGGTTFFWIFMIVMTPVITMKLGAEERKTGTIETLMTAPVSDLEVVIGKYLGAMALYAAAWLPTVLYVWALTAYSKVDAGPVISGYLGVLMVGMFFIAIGLFTSLVSKNQVVAAILCFAILLLLILISILTFLVTDPFWKPILQYVDLWSIMQGFAKGVVDSRSVVYCLSGTALFLALGYQAMQTRRWR
ncbi:MAG: ABC transporter permease [Acidobacteriota bacterium]